MGCTSGKAIKKRTTSLDDVAQKKEAPQQNATAPDKNGQVTQGKQTSNAILIPGANKSFLAPDGIPYIDEDVDSEGEPESQIPNAKVTSSSPDQNKNTISNKQNAAPKSHSALPTADSQAVTSPGSRVVMETTRTEIITSGDQQQPAVIQHILETEFKQTSAKHSTTERAPGESTTAAAMVPANDASPHEEVAATKIQAGIRGYLDRKKVKAIKSNQEPVTCEDVRFCQNQQLNNEYNEGDRSPLFDDKAGGNFDNTPDDPDDL